MLSGNVVGAAFIFTLHFVFTIYFIVIFIIFINFY